MYLDWWVLIIFGDIAYDSRKHWLGELSNPLSDAQTSLDLSQKLKYHYRETIKILGQCVFEKDYVLVMGIHGQP